MNKCATCGKVDNINSLGTCLRCDSVKYCSFGFHMTHLAEHVKLCPRMFLFKQPPMEECPICNVAVSHGVTKMTYHACCGKTFCNGCKHAIMVSMAKQGKRGYVPSEHAASLVKIAKKNSMCPFCRSETWTDDKA